MFRNKSAWFSSSVPNTCHNFWTLEGGIVAGWTKADYLFSNDATCPDTLRIFESKDFLWDKVVVFHSLFLSACAKRQSIKSVCIGHYVLPPASVQDEVRNVVGRMIWECEEEQSVEQGFHKSSSSRSENEHSKGAVSGRSSEASDTDSTESEAALGEHMQDIVSNNITGYVNMEDLPEYPGELCDFFPGCFRCSTCKAHCCLPHS